MQNKRIAQSRGKRVLYIQYSNPAAFPPLEHSSRILSKQGWEVMFLGIRTQETEQLVFRKCKGIRVDLLSDCPVGWRNRFRYIYFLFWVIAKTLLWKPKWIYASDFYACVPALPLKILLRRRVIYHEHDSPVRNESTSDSIFLMFRKMLARRADICIVPNSQRANVFRAETSSLNTMVVWNCSAVEDTAGFRNYQQRDELCLLYQGSIVPPRLPIQVIQALKMTSTIRLRVIGYETALHKGYLRKLHELACSLGVADRFEYVGSLPHNEVLQWCQQSDIGLSLMPTDESDINMTHMTGASNKAFEYLSTGMALLVSDLPDWNSLFVAPGYGLSCDPKDPESIHKCLTWFLDHQKEMRAMGEHGRQRILAEWNYEKQFAPVLFQMKSAALQSDLRVDEDFSTAQLEKFAQDTLER